MAFADTSQAPQNQCAGQSTSGKASNKCGHASGAPTRYNLGKKKPPQDYLNYLIGVAFYRRRTFHMCTSTCT